MKTFHRSQPIIGREQQHDRRGAPMAYSCVCVYMYVHHILFDGNSIALELHRKICGEIYSYLCILYKS